MKWYKLWIDYGERVSYWFEWSDSGFSGSYKVCKFDHVQHAIFHEELLIEAGYGNIEDESHWS